MDCLTPLHQVLEDRCKCLLNVLRVVDTMCRIFIHTILMFSFTANSSAGVTWGIVVALILVGVIVFVLLYFRRRVRNLKTEIAHVQYIADPQSQPDRHHFDNPVYAFPSNQAHNDNSTLINNLRPQKPSNLDRCRLGYSDSSSTSTSSRGIYIHSNLAQHAYCLLCIFVSSAHIPPII